MGGGFRPRDARSRPLNSRRARNYQKNRINVELNGNSDKRIDVSEFGERIQDVFIMDRRMNGSSPACIAKGIMNDSVWIAASRRSSRSSLLASPTRYLALAHGRTFFFFKRVTTLFIQHSLFEIVLKHNCDRFGSQIEPGEICIQLACFQKHKGSQADRSAGRRADRQTGKPASARVSQSADR